MVLLLSVFNGFENLLLSMYNAFDPQLKITSVQGKTFYADAVNNLLNEHEDILYFTDVLEEKVLMKNGDNEFIALIKGVGGDFSKMTKLDSIIVEGEGLTSYQNQSVAILGQGVSYHLSIGVGNMFNRLKIFAPNRESTTLLNPQNAFSSTSVLPIGIFRLGAEYDNKYIITPIAFLQDLLQQKKFLLLKLN